MNAFFHPFDPSIHPPIHSSIHILISQPPVLSWAQTNHCAARTAKDQITDLEVHNFPAYRSYSRLCRVCHLGLGS
jgi:hypothetical protein